MNEANLQARFQKRFHASGPGGLLGRLRAREASIAGHRQFNRSQGADKFYGLRPTLVADTHDPMSKGMFPLNFQRARSSVIEVLVGFGLVFTLSKNGILSFYDQTTFKPLGYLNQFGEQIVRSIFINYDQEALITVSAFQHDEFRSLSCTSIPIASIRAGRIHDSEVIFGGTAFRYPGFIEFDRFNSAILTFAPKRTRSDAQLPEAGVYSVWDMRDYSLLFHIDDDGGGINDVRIGRDLVLVIHKRTKSSVKVRLLDIRHGGKELLCRKILLHRSADIQCLELCDHRLFVLQSGQPLHVHDLLTGETLVKARGSFPSPDKVLYLHAKRTLLTVTSTAILVWDLNGDRVATLEANVLLAEEQCTMVAPGEDVLITYSRGSGRDTAAFTIFDLNTWTYLWQVSSKPDATSSEVEQVGLTPEIRKEALGDVRCMAYDDLFHEIICADGQGLLFKWSNQPYSALVDNPALRKARIAPDFRDYRPPLPSSPLSSFSSPPVSPESAASGDDAIDHDSDSGVAPMDLSSD